MHLVLCAHTQNTHTHKHTLTHTHCAHTHTLTNKPHILQLGVDVHLVLLAHLEPEVSH